jgi:ribose/xylose/arabinose/galactoside ABC-type transport system permease subunit
VASARPVTTNRGVQLSVGALHVLLGVALALFMNHYARDFSFLLAREWYDSYWLPLWVACLTYAFEALLVRLPAGWLYGLLITATPYGWYAAIVTVLYFENRSEATSSEYLRIAVPALLLALSGGILNPAIVWLVSRTRQDRSS